MAKKKELFRQLNEGVLKQDKKIIRTESIKQIIHILPELRDLIPPLRPDEYEALEENLLANGCRDAILVWEKDDEYILVDGHNRYSICSKHQLDFNIKILDFTSLEEVKSFMIDNQLGRRNLTPEQASYLRGMKYNREKLEKGKYDRAGQKGQNVPYEEETKATSEKLADEFKVSEKTIKRDALYAAGLERIGQLNGELKAGILSGNIKVKKAEVQAFAKISDNVQLESPEDISAIAKKIQEQETNAAEKRPGQTPAKRTSLDPDLAGLKYKIIQLAQKLGTKDIDNEAVYLQLQQMVDQLKNYVKP